jgi:DNA-binding CsgD family transcriptional regulator
VTIAGERIQPAHPLVAHVAYEAVDPATRRAIHRRLAETATTDEERALHLGRSVAGTDAGAAAVIEAAGREARARGVRALTATLFESAARITPPDDIDDWARRHVAAASAWYDAGDTHRVESLLEPLIAALPPGRWRAEARWRLGTALDEAGRWQEALALWTAALDDTDDLATRSQVRCSLAITAMYVQTHAVAMDSAAAAVADAEGGADPRALAQALAVDAFVRAMGGIADDGSEMARALALEAELDEHLGEWSPSALAAERARHTGDVLAARVHYQSVLDRATTRGDANIEQWASFGLASAEVVAGGFAHAAALSEFVLDVAEQTDVMRIPARWLRGQVDAWLGRFDEARRLADEAMAMATAADETFHQFAVAVVRATIALGAGDAETASDAFAAARQLATELGLAHATVLRTFLQEVEAASAAGRIDQARDALAAFETAVGGDVPPWSPPMIARARGALLAARGDLGGAAAELEAAIADPVSLDPDRGRAQLALAAVLRRARELRRSREAGEAALETFERIGSPPWADLARRELARLPGRRPGSTGELTNAESAIARLVASGRSNREVAAELVLSVKTVEVTLTRVYEKLGLRSRTELAAHLRERAGEPL